MAWWAEETGQGGPGSSGTEKLRHLYSASQFFFPMSVLQLWDTVRGQLASQHTCPKPLNCTAFHPEGQILAIGSWAGSFSFVQVDGLRVTKVRCAGWPWGRNHRRVVVEAEGWRTSASCVILLLGCE